MDTKKNTNTVQSIARAANILFYLSNGINNITDLAKNCILSKSTVHRLLKALKESNLVIQDPSNQQYHLGPLITRISSNPYIANNYLIACSMQEMNRLWNLIEETVSLNIMFGMQYIRLFGFASKHDLRVIDSFDPIGPIFVGASAKVLLSQLNDKELYLAINTLVFQQITEHSVTDKDILMQQIKSIRQQGYAVSYGERIAGALCISVPVASYQWPSALSLIGPESRLASKVDELIIIVKNTAENINKRIRNLLQDTAVVECD